MTKLEHRIRRTMRIGRDEIVVALYPGGEIGFRVLRHRTEYRLPLSACFMLAADRHAATLKRERLARRKARS